MTEKSGQNQAGRFQKGMSGNPSGKPKGARARVQEKKCGTAGGRTRVIRSLKEHRPLDDDAVDALVYLILGFVGEGIAPQEVHYV